MGLVREIKTESPNNHGGYLWVYIGPRDPQELQDRLEAYFLRSTRPRPKSYGAAN